MFSFSDFKSENTVKNIQNIVIDIVYYCSKFHFQFSIEMKKFLLPKSRHEGEKWMSNSDSAVKKT